MKSFSQIFKESVKDHDSVSLLQSEISSYISKVNRILPKNIQVLISLTEKYNLTTKESLEEIRNSNKSGLKDLSAKYNIPTEKIDLIYDLLKHNSRSLRLLPQYQTKYEREAVMAGKLAKDDLTIDLDSPAGRNAAAKMYTPLVLKISSQYVGKSRLDKPSLISAGMEGLTNAMTDWKKPGEDDKKKSSFRTYASYRIQQAILDEINNNGHTLSGGGWYASKKYGAAALDAISLDGVNSDSDDDDFKNDRQLGASVSPTDPEADVAKEEDYWSNLFNILNSKFTTRDMDIFYRYFGLGPYHGKRQKSKDIAKEYKMSEGNIRNSIINKIIDFLRNNPEARQSISVIKDIYTESLLCETIGMDKEYIKETFYHDSTYLLLEEVTRWNDKGHLVNAVYAACDKLKSNDVKIILDFLTRNTDYLNANIKKNKNLVSLFLSEIYPFISMRHKSEQELAAYMHEIMDAGKMLKISW